MARSEKRKRNHVIPDLLLRRFSSRRKEKSTDTTHLVWQFSKSAPPVEISTRDAQVGNYFYGRDGDVEAKLGLQETKIGAALAKIDVGHHPESFSDILTEFIWTLSLRTRAFRAAAQNMFKFGVQQLANSATEANVQGLIARRAEERFEELVEEHLASSPLYERIMAEELLRAEKVKEVFAKNLLINMTKLEPRNFFVNNLRLLLEAGVIEEQFPEIHSAAIAETVGVEPPTAFRPAAYHVMNWAEPSVVLGDMGLFATTEERTVSALQKDLRGWFQVYVPISSRAVLVATRSDAEPNLSLDEINSCSARMSAKYLYSAINDNSAAILASTIGTFSPLASEEELAAIAASVWG